MYPDPLPAGPAATLAPRWNPDEFGMGKATFISLVLVGAIVAAFLVGSQLLKPPATPVVVQITQATLTTLPKPTPPPPPKVIPPPKPLPVVIPKPPPVPSKIVVATKAPPPVHHIFKPVPKPVVNTAPPPPTPAPVSAAPQPPAARTDGVPIYGAQMHDIIQSNQDVPPALASLGVSGTAIIRIVVAPDGDVVSASIVKSSGVPLIDQTALDHAMHAHLPAFNANMPNANSSFTIPVEIVAQDSDQ